MSFFISNAMADAAAPAAAGPMGGGFEWIFLVGFLVIFYLMIWRPQAKRSKEHKNLLSGLQKGDEVVTSAGIAGKVTKVLVLFGALGLGTPDHQIEDDQEAQQEYPLETTAGRGSGSRGGCVGIGGGNQKAHDLLLLQDIGSVGIFQSSGGTGSPRLA